MEKIKLNDAHRQLWKTFYNSEQKLFKMLNKQCTCLYSSGDEELRYVKFVCDNGAVLTKPPRFIHWIGHLKNDPDEIINQCRIVRREYASAMGKKFMKYLSRFPVHYTNVEQINVRQHLAFSSVRVTGEYVTLKNFFDTKDILPYMEKLRAAGFTPKVIDNVLFKSLMLSTAEFFDMAGSDHIQMRKCTGMQYCATVRRAGQSRGDRVMLGLMIIDQHSNPAVVSPLKEAPRPHSLAACGREILLPVDTPYQFYARHSPASQPAIRADR